MPDRGPASTRRWLDVLRERLAFWLAPWLVHYSDDGAELGVVLTEEWPDA